MKQHKLLSFAIANVKRQFEAKDGPLYDRVVATRILPNSPDHKDGSLERMRLMRSEGRENCSAAFCAALASLDIRSGVIKCMDHGRLEIAGLRVLSERAYGPLIHDEVSIRRIERGMRIFVNEGLISSSSRAEQSSCGSWTAKASIKRIVPAVWDLIGLSKLWAYCVGEKEAKRKAEAMNELQKTLDTLEPERDCKPVGAQAQAALDSARDRALEEMRAIFS